MCEDGSVCQITNYYASGLPYFDQSSNKNEELQPYKYNGKELDRMHGLNLYDFSARQYDPSLGQFTAMDPLCEKYYHLSPYAYCGGNPVNYIDPTGMEQEDSNGGTSWTTSDPDEIAKIMYYLQHGGTVNALFETYPFNQMGWTNGATNDGYASGSFAYGTMASWTCVAPKPFTPIEDPTSNLGWVSALSNRVNDIHFGTNGRIYLRKYYPVEYKGIPYDIIQGKIFNGNQYVGVVKLDANMLKCMSKAIVGISVGVAAGNVYNAYQYDQSITGRNVVREVAKGVGSISGAMIGSRIGEWAGGVIGACFGGCGAIPGMIVGNVVGGWLGGLAGEWVGETLVDYCYK